jgi:AcrR family transcriptional regulator
MGRPRSDIQPRILHAARARFLADGVDGASLRNIAKEAKTSIGMVFYYYPTKDALFLAVVEEVYAKLLADLERILAPTEDGEATVRERLGRAFARFGQASDDEIDVVRLVVREALVSSDRFRAVHGRFRSGHVAMILRTLAEGVDRGEIDDMLPLAVVLAATFGVGGVPQVMRRVAGKQLPFALPSADALAESALAILFEGIGTKEKTKKPEGVSAASRPRRARR